MKNSILIIVGIFTIVVFMSFKHEAKKSCYSEKGTSDSCLVFVSSKYAHDSHNKKVYKCTYFNQCSTTIYVRYTDWNGTSGVRPIDGGKTDYLYSFRETGVEIISIERKK